MTVFNIGLSQGKVSDTVRQLAAQFLAGTKKLTIEAEEYRLTSFVTVIDENTARFDYLGKLKTEVQVTVTLAPGADLYGMVMALVVTKGKGKGTTLTLYTVEPGLQGMYAEDFGRLQDFLNSGRRELAQPAPDRGHGPARRGTLTPGTEQL